MGAAADALVMPRPLAHRQLEILLQRVLDGHNAAHALSRSLEGRTVAIIGVTGDELAAFETVLGRCGATPTRDLGAADAAVVGSRPSRRDMARLAAGPAEPLTAEDLAAVTAVRSSLAGDRAEPLKVFAPLPIDEAE